MPDDAPDLLRQAPDFEIESDGRGMLTDDHASLIITFSRPEIRQQLSNLENLVATNAAEYQQNAALACYRMPRLLKSIPTDELELCCRLWQQSIVIGVERVRTQGESTFFSGLLPEVSADLSKISSNDSGLKHVGVLLLVNSQASMYIINGTTPSSVTDASDKDNAKPLRGQILDHLKDAYLLYSNSNGTSSNPVAVVLNDGHGIHFSCLVTVDGRSWVLVDSSGSAFPPQADLHDGLARRFLRMLYDVPTDTASPETEPWMTWSIVSQCKIPQKPDSIRYKQVDSISCLLTSMAFIYYNVCTGFKDFPFVWRPVKQIYLSILDRTRYFCVLFPHIQAELKFRSKESLV
jgi:hypothetical protein